MYYSIAASQPAPAIDPAFLHEEAVPDALDPFPQSRVTVQSATTSVTESLVVNGAKDIAANAILVKRIFIIIKIKLIKY